MGYYNARIDGIFGKATEAAISEFQADIEVDVDGKPTADLAVWIGAAVALSSEPDTPKPKPENRTRSPRLVSTGSGFFIDGAGHFITNAHVIEQCSRISTENGGLMTVIKSDERIDLALLSSASRPAAFASIAPRSYERLGEDVVTAGYPLSDILGTSLNVTKGIISSKSGIDGDDRFLQFTAPIQPGNSGGPILNGSGQVVGVIVAQLDASEVFGLSGTVPQNVNFAISGGSLLDFLREAGVPVRTQPNLAQRSTAEIADLAMEFTAHVECYR